MIINDTRVKRNTRMLRDFLKMMGTKLGLEGGRQKNNNNKHLYSSYSVPGTFFSILYSSLF